MIPNPGNALLQWWKGANRQQRAVAGIVLFSLICTAALLMVTDSSGAGEASLDLSPWYMVGVFFKMVFVLALFIGAAVIVRRNAGRGLNLGSMLRQSTQPERQLEIVETIRPAPRQALHLLRIGKKFFLVGATDQNFSLLSALGEEADFACSPSVTSPEGQGANAASGSHMADVRVDSQAGEITGSFASVLAALPQTGLD